MDTPSRPRVLSGMRPTGALHLGHLTGALDNWVRLQDTYDCFYSVVDYHALTPDYADPSSIRLNVIEVALDWLAAGIDPARSCVFIQSLVPEHAELHLLLSMTTPVAWLERVPVHDGEEALVFVHEAHPVVEGAGEMADVQGAGRPHPGEDARTVHATSPYSSPMMKRFTGART